MNLLDKIKDYWFGFSLGTALVLIIIFVLYEAYLNSSVHDATVVDHHYQSAYVNTYVTHVGSSTTISTQYVPEQWQLEVIGTNKFNDERDFMIEVSHEEYLTITNGQRLKL